MNEIKEQREFYNERWASFEYPGHLELDRTSKVIDLMRYVKYFNNICDLGCGAGWIAGILGHFGKTLGVDLSNVDRARVRFPNCEFISANILEWKYPKAEFDLVVSAEVVEHFPYPLQSEYIRICFEILKPGGSMILTTPNKKTMDAIPGGGRTWSNQPIEDWLDSRNLIRLLTANGFQVKRRSSITLGIGNMGFYRFVNSVRFNRIIEKLGMLDAWHAIVLKFEFGLHLAVVAEKPSV